jgi:hypothetical protein
LGAISKKVLDVVSFKMWDIYKIWEDTIKSFTS